MSKKNFASIIPPPKVKQLIAKESWLSLPWWKGEWLSECPASLAVQETAKRIIVCPTALQVLIWNLHNWEDEEDWIEVK